MPTTRIAKIGRKPRPFADDWPALFSLRDCSPRSEFPFVLRRVAGNLYRFADQGYVHLGRLSDVRDGHTPTCLRVLKLFWARNDDAAIVAALLHRRIGRDGVYHCRKINRRKLDAGNATPPKDLLRNLAAGWTNGDTYRAARKHKIPIREHASYDGSGQFIYKTVPLPRLQVFYASRLKNDGELPMAVEILPNRNLGS